MTRFRTLILSALMLFVPLVGADDSQLVDDPAYRGWDDAAIGTVVHAVGTIESRGTTGSLKQSRKLIERTPESLTIELSSTITDPNGKVWPGPGKVYVVRAKVPLDRVHVPDEIEGSAKIIREETITIAGKSYKCTVIQVEGTMGSGSANVTDTRWKCDDVIGRTVRSETTIEREGEKVTTKLELDSIEIP